MMIGPVNVFIVIGVVAFAAGSILAGRRGKFVFVLALGVISVAALVAGVVQANSFAGTKPVKVATATVAAAAPAKTTLERGDIVVLNGKPVLVTVTFGKTSHAVVLGEGGTAQLFPGSFGPDVIVVKKADRARQAGIVLDAIRRKHRIE